jgi:hypothetical protein
LKKVFFVVFVLSLFFNYSFADTFVITKNGNVRSGPSTKYSIIDKCKPGDIVYNTSLEGNWIIVKSGYVTEYRHKILGNLFKNKENAEKFATNINKKEKPAPVVNKTKPQRFIEKVSGFKEIDMCRYRGDGIMEIHMNKRFFDLSKTEQNFFIKDLYYEWKKIDGGILPCWVNVHFPGTNEFIIYPPL